jgi:hypothetical protein
MRGAGAGLLPEARPVERSAERLNLGARPYHPWASPERWKYFEIFISAF